MHIVFAASESAPWVKTGGLGEVVGALPSALARIGHRVTLYLPLYRTVTEELEHRGGADNLPVALASLTVPFPGYNRFVRMLNGGEKEGVQTYFLDCPEMFDREGIYGTPASPYPDNAERFGLYCRAVIEASKLLGVPDVFHAHDWQAALVTVLLRTSYDSDPLLRRAASVFTVHNAGYQGDFPRTVLGSLLLPEALYTTDLMEAYGRVNLFKGGLLFADALTTVSGHYAEELLTPEYGAGLDGVFRQRREVMTGILNGVDYSDWDPSRDSHIAAHYSAERLEGKLECRRDLLHAFGADGVSDETAVIGVVSRLTSQKGFDLLAEIMQELAKEDVVLLVLGTGEEHYERLFRQMADRYHDRLKVQIYFDETMAHKVEAGSDLSLMPSRYEPSGLAQMYSLRYGTVPVVRATGGLEDTVSEGPDGDGFRFEEYTGKALLDAIRRALKARKNKPAWEAMMRRGMALDFSWTNPAREYAAVYERVVATRSWR